MCPPSSDTAVPPRAPTALRPRLPSSPPRALPPAAPPPLPRLPPSQSPTLRTAPRAWQRPSRHHRAALLDEGVAAAGCGGCWAQARCRRGRRRPGIASRRSCRRRWPRALAHGRRLSPACFRSSPLFRSRSMYAGSLERGAASCGWRSAARAVRAAHAPPAPCCRPSMLRVFAQTRQPCEEVDEGVVAEAVER